MQQIQVTCDGCDVDMIDVIGTGMAGIENLLCGCDSCELFVTKHHSGPRDGKPRPKFRCRNCRKLLRVIAPVDDEYGDTEEWDYPCPVCEGHLFIVDMQIEMD